MITTNRARVTGVVTNTREMKWGAFVIVHQLDGTKIQVVTRLEDDVPKTNDYVEISGTVHHPDKPINDQTLQPYEVHAESITVLSKGGPWIDNSLLHRVTADAAIFRTMHHLAADFRTTYEDAIEIHTPRLIAGSSEGGADVFSVDYFGDRRTLAQSPQLYKQIMCNALMGPVIEIGPFFRAEGSNSSKHLHEFTSMDFETVLEKPLVSHVIKHALDFFMPNFGQSALQIPLNDAMDMLGKPGQTDLTREDESKLWDMTGEDIIVVTNFPAESRAFYTYKDQSFDVLYKGLEVCSGSVRKFEVSDYVEAMRKRGMDPANFEEYLSALSQRSVYTGGFAIGLERMACQFYGINNVNRATIS